MASVREREEQVVEEHHFRKGLHCLGKTFNNASHAYLSLRLASLDLATVNVSLLRADDCQGIQKYKYLQTVDVSGNNLTSLTALSSLKHLIKLIASHNKLTNMLDFEPPANLEMADYSHNAISRIERVNKNKYLKVLILDCN